MIYGHGDDLYSYPDIQANFSSNCYGEADHTNLINHLQKRLPELISAYPHPDAGVLKKIMVDKSRDITSDQVAFFNGATEAIYLIARILKDRKTIIATPTFSEYASAAAQNGTCMKEIPLEKLIRLDSSVYATLFGRDTCVWICNPNNPDGTVFPKEKLKEMFQTNPETRFIIDQSYADFTDAPVLSAGETASNVILINSLTKQYTIPGLRLGYVIGNEKIIAEIERLRMPWSVNAIAIEAGKFLLNENTDFATMRKVLFAEKIRLIKALEDTGFIKTIPSETHYFLARLLQGQVDEMKRFLAERHGVLIRNAENFAPHYSGYFRIAVQSAKKNNLLITAIKHYVSSL